MLDERDCIPFKNAQVGEMMGRDLAEQSANARSMYIDCKHPDLRLFECKRNGRLSHSKTNFQD